MKSERAGATLARMKGIALVVVLVGCASDPQKPVENPTGCITLTGNQSQDVPVMTDASVCMHLDATPLARAHFMADLPSVAGTTSGYSISLVDSNGAPLADGGDLVIGNTMPYARAQLEWSPPAGVTTDATLVVRAGSPTATMLSIALLDPLE